MSWSARAGPVRPGQPSERVSNTRTAGGSTDATSVAGKRALGKVSRRARRWRVQTPGLCMGVASASVCVDVQHCARASGLAMARVSGPQISRRIRRRHTLDHRLVTARAGRHQSSAQVSGCDASRPGPAISSHGGFHGAFARSRVGRRPATRGDWARSQVYQCRPLRHPFP